MNESITEMCVVLYIWNVAHTQIVPNMWKCDAMGRVQSLIRNNKTACKMENNYGPN